ncbi:Fic family protein [uncultured Anaerococcus sp.]|uniref:Fic family protein n=1 Tax=uncultured Anaerococcus sp. TaxID=293428 RepID=UPI00288BB8CD|nr:Fic family protein [uncultured Anaerococcus sp.]
MEYLYKIYYKYKDQYESVYKSRINNEVVEKIALPYKIKQKIPISLYFLPSIKTMALVEAIKKNDQILMVLAEGFKEKYKEYLFIDLIANDLEASNLLEGIESNKDEIIYSTKKILEEKKPNDKRFGKTLNSYRLLLDNKLNPPKTNEDIRKIYDNITSGEIEKENLPDGKFHRKGPVYIQKAGSVSGQVIHQGVSGEDEIGYNMECMIDFMAEPDLPSLIKIAISHYYFAYTHPFYDGNGRVGRFLSAIYLKKDYSYLTALSLSKGSLIERTTYYKAFDKTNDPISKGEVNFFVDSFLELIIKGQENIFEYFNKVTENLIEHFKKIENKLEAMDDLDLNLVDIFLMNKYFAANQTMERNDIILDLEKDDQPVSRIKERLDYYQEIDLIKAVKKRPLMYVLNEEIL